MKPITVWISSTLLALCAALTLASDFEMIRWTADGGGNIRLTGWDLEISATVGQADASTLMTGGEFDLTSGFWIRQADGDCNYDAAIDLFDFDEFTECVTEAAGDYPQPHCACFDFDGDEDVDLIDFGQFQMSFTG